MRSKLLDFIDECGSFELAAQRLKMTACSIANMAWGFESLSVTMWRRLSMATDTARNGREALRQYMALKGVDRAGAAALLGVSESYLAQQSSLREPTGAVMGAIRRELQYAADPARHAAETMELARALSKQSGRPLTECVAQLGAQGLQVPEIYAGATERARHERNAALERSETGETVEQYNARVLAERKAKP